MGNMKDYYVYIDRRGSNRSVFYVGIGSVRSRRFFTPLRKNRKWMFIALKDKGYSREIIYHSLSELDAKILEIRTTKKYGRENLANFTDGGDGSSGRQASLETRKKISMSHTGKKLSKSHVDAIRKANIGRKMSEAHKVKLIKFHTGRKRSAETCARIGATSKGRIKTLATRLKLSKSLKGREFSQETKSRMSLSADKRKRSQGGQFI